MCFGRVLERTSLFIMTIAASMCRTVRSTAVVAKAFGCVGVVCAFTSGRSPSHRVDTIDTAVNGGDPTTPLYRCFVQCFRKFDHLRPGTVMHTLSPEGRKPLSISPSTAPTNHKDGGRHSGRVTSHPSQH